MPEFESITLTVSEAATVLGVSRTTAYECVRTGQLRALRLVVPRDAITELLAPPVAQVDPVENAVDVVVGPVSPVAGEALR